VALETATPGSSTTLNHTSSAACSNGTFSLGSGAYFNLPVIANSYYTFSWANGGANMSGFCAVPQNGTGEAFNANQTNFTWFSGTTTTLRVSAVRSSETWVGTSGVMTYRYAPIQVNATAGTAGPAYYANLATAFSAISNGTHQGAVTVRVNCSITGHPAATLGASGTGGANYTSVNIFPTANVSITGNTNGPLINLNGADNVTIDGRLNGSSTSKSLTITNQATGTSASVIQLILSARQNTIRDLTITGAGTGTSRGMIYFATDLSGGTDGNSNNTITNCNFTGIDATTARPQACIYSLGTATALNRNNSVTNNHFYNFYRTNGTSYGIYAHTSSSNWTITGNHFYETTNLVPTANSSYINIRVLDASNGTGHTISNNFIGGKAASAGGSAMSIVSTTNQPIFYGILTSSSNGTSTPSSIQGNTIANIGINSRHNSVFRGIQVDGGTWNVGTTTGNTIGAATGTGNITLTSPLSLSNQVTATATATVSGGSVTAINIGTNTAIYTSAPTVTISASNGGGTLATATAVLGSNGTISSFNITNGGTLYTSATVTIAAPAFVSTSYGILLNSTGTLDVRNNRVAAINIVGSTDWSHNFYGIYRNTAVGVNTTINNNLIGSATANSIHCSSATSNVRGQSLWGIRVNTNSPCTISGNIIDNLRNAYTGTGSSTVSTTVGISAQDNRADGSNTITDNIIRNIATASAGAGVTTSTTLMGIFLSNTTAGSLQNISNNTIHELTASNGTAAVNVVGIYFGGSSASSHTLSRNFIHSLNVSSTSATAAVYGIRLNSGSPTLSNNIINVGTGASNGNLIYGIYEPGTASNNVNLYYNTVVVSGTTASTSTNRTYGMWSNGTANTKNIRNNIFHNARSGGGAAVNQNFAIRLAGTTGLTINYNDYFVTGTGGTLGQMVAVNHATLDALRIATGQDVNSYNKNPLYSTNPPTTVATHYRASCGLNAVTGTGITVDYSNGTRNASTPTVGAWEALNAIPGLATTSNNGSRCGTGTVSISVSGVPSGTTIDWYSQATGGSVLSGGTGTATFITPSISTTTTYYAETRHSTNGCTSSIRRAVTATVHPAVAASIASQTNVNCFGGNNGAINISVSGGTTPFAYAWTGGITTQNRSGLVQGTYNVTITDANLCTATTGTTITQPAQDMVLNTSFNSSTCGNSNGSVTVTLTNPSQSGGAASTYTWSPNIGSTATVNNVSAGSYQVTVTNVAGCTKSTSINVTDAGAPTANITSQTNLVCFGGNNGSASVNVSGGTAPYNIVWSNGNTQNNVPAGTYSTSTGLFAGIISAQVTDVNSCNASASTTITAPPQLIASVSNATNVSCFGNNNGSITLSVSGGTGVKTFNWSGPSAASGQNPTGLSAGNYNVTVTDANSCQVVVPNIVIGEPAVLSASVSGTVDVSCFGNNNGSITLSVSGGTGTKTFNWSGPSSASGQNPSGLLAGNYNVTVTDANSCQVVVSNIVIGEPVELSTNVSSIVDVSCFGGNNGVINLSVSGGVGTKTFNWSGPSSASGQNPSGLLAGNYNVTVADANACSVTLGTSVSQPSELSADIINISDADCFGSSTGAITVSVAGGTLPLRFRMV
jgi:hypothetical protein